jgi:hypothetical protein
VLHGLAHHGLGRAKQKHARAASLCDPRDVVEQVSRRDAFRQRRLVEEARDQYQRHAVRVNEVGFEK